MVPNVPAIAGLGKLIDALRQVLAQSPEIRLAILFGSQANGATHSESDVDIAYLGRCRDRMQLTTKLLEACGQDIDLVSLHSAGVPLLEEVVHNGVLIYESGPNVFSAWRSHALAELELDRSWYNRMRDAWLKAIAEKGV